MSATELLVDIGGGVALLLWATRMVRTGIERAYGDGLRRALGRATRGRARAAAVGLGVATVLQSSAATAILTVSCAGAGLLSTATGLAIMLGADVGSTLVVQLLSFDLAWLSPALLLAGVALFLASGQRRHRQTGRILIGLGLMLLALRLTVAASLELRDSDTLAAVIAALAGEPALAMLLAALLTWLAHSSVAIVLLVMSLAAAGLLPLALALALVLGANVGSALIPLLLSWRAAPAARRIPLGNLLFRLTGALLALTALQPLADAVAATGEQAARQVANFHTLFNLALALTFLPLTGFAARLTERLLPDYAVEADDVPLTTPSRLDPALTDSPKLALACATREVLRMADRVEAMLRYALATFRHDDKAQALRLGRIDDEVDRMHAAIKRYLTEVSRNRLDDEDSRRCMEILTFTIKLEQIGDIVEKNLLASALKTIKGSYAFSEQGWQELSELHAAVVANMALALNVFVSGDRDSARRLVEAKQAFGRLEHRSNRRHLSRLRAGRADSVDSSAIHLDVTRDLKQINSLLTSVAYPILYDAGELLQSRLKTPQALAEVDEDDDD